MNQASDNSENVILQEIATPISNTFIGVRMKFEMGDIAARSLQDEEYFYRVFGVDGEIMIDHAWGIEPVTMKHIKSYKYELPHIHPHAFRYTVASTMIADGIDLVTAASELGHADATTTAKIYAHQIAEAKAKAAEVRSNVFARAR